MSDTLASALEEDQKVVKASFGGFGRKLMDFFHLSDGPRPAQEWARKLQRLQGYSREAKDAAPYLFYSKLYHNVAQARRGRGTGMEWLREIENSGVRAEELEDTGLKQFLVQNSDQRITREQIIDAITPRQLDVRVINLRKDNPRLEWKHGRGYSLEGGRRVSTFDAYYTDSTGERQKAKETFYARAAPDRDGVMVYNERGYPITMANTYDDALAKIRETRSHLHPEPTPIPDAHLNKWVPGARNYQEFYFGMPSIREPLAAEMDLLKQEAQILRERIGLANRGMSPDDTQPLFDRLIDVANRHMFAKRQIEAAPDEYYGGHGGFRNAFALFRTTDREVTAPDGQVRKILYVEEGQSDLHAKGREEGYQGYPNEIPQKGSDGNIHVYKEEEEAALVAKSLMDSGQGQFAARPRGDGWMVVKQTEEGGVPNAPFKENWPRPSLAYLIAYAKENGYDGIGFAHAGIVGKRWNKVYTIDRATYDPETKALVVSGSEGQGQRYNSVTLAQLDEYLPEAEANKIREQLAFDVDQNDGTLALSSDATDEMAQRLPELRGQREDIRQDIARAVQDDLPMDLPVQRGPIPQEARTFTWDDVLTYNVDDDIMVALKANARGYLERNVEGVERYHILNADGEFVGDMFDEEWEAREVIDDIAREADRHPDNYDVIEEWALYNRATGEQMEWRGDEYFDYDPETDAIDDIVDSPDEWEEWGVKDSIDWEFVQDRTDGDRPLALIDDDGLIVEGSIDIDEPRVRVLPEPDEVVGPEFEPGEVTRYNLGLKGEATTVQGEPVSRSVSIDFDKPMYVEQSPGQNAKFRALYGYPGEKSIYKSTTRKILGKKAKSIQGTFQASNGETIPVDFFTFPNTEIKPISLYGGAAGAVLGAEFVTDELEEALREQSPQ